jgi:integrase
MASISKRSDGKWRARYREPEGKERAGHFPTRAKAQAWLDAQTASLVTGTYVDPKVGRKTTFRNYAESWRQVQLHRPGTARSVEQQLRLHVYPRIGARPIAAIRPTEIQSLVRELSEKLAPGTARVAYGRVVSIFRAAVRDRVIASSPCTDVKRPPASGSAKLEVLTTEHVLALAEAVPKRYSALIVTGAGLGLRPGELFGLTVDRVDFLRRTVTVDRQLLYTKGESVKLAPLKTTASYRTLPLPRTVAEALAAHLAAFPTDGFVFTNERDAPIQGHPFSAVWERARKAAGLPAWATPHALRHYYASLLIQSGASVKAVQARLGHGSAIVTLDTYGHLWPDEEDRTRAAVDTAFENLADFSRTTGVSSA